MYAKKSGIFSKVYSIRSFYIFFNEYTKKEWKTYKNKTNYFQTLKDKKKIAELQSEQEVRLADVECLAVICFHHFFI